MAELKVSIGDEIKDGFKEVDAWVANGIDWLDDIQGFYREKAAIEKEYSSKLGSLTSRYFEKKAKISTNLSVGDSPQVTPGSLENASLVAWNEVLSQNEKMSREHARLSDELTLQISDQIHGAQMKFDHLRKMCEAFNEKLVEARDTYYSELKKSKSNYDSTCQSMEKERLKASKSGRDKASKKVDDKQRNMNNAKNEYLIKINVANRVKDKFYHEDTPELLDTLQILNEARVAVVNGFWNKAIDLEKAFFSRCTECLNDMSAVVAQNHVTLDSAMFTKHNLKPFSEPSDFVYEPSPIWHEDEDMVTDETSALQHLRDMLNTSSKRLTDYQQSSEAKLEVYKKLVEEEKDLPPTKLSPFAQHLGKRIQALQSLTLNESLRLICDVETETIEVAVGGKDLSALPETERKKKGLFGIRSHRHDGGRDGSGVNQLTTTASNLSLNSSTSGISGSHHRAGGGIVSSILGRSRRSASGADGLQHAKALYAYEPQGDDEIDLQLGEDIVVTEEDDGSGWTAVRKSTGNQGLVPTSYLELGPKPDAVGESPGKKKGPAVAPKRGARKVSYLVAQYDYEATSPDELSIKTGDRIIVVSEDNGDGWTEGELGGQTGLFPTAYTLPA